MASHDRLGLEAIKSLHSQLDDDANGNVDLSESDDVKIFILLKKISLTFIRTAYEIDIFFF